MSRPMVGIGAMVVGLAAACAGSLVLPDAAHAEGLTVPRPAITLEAVPKLADNVVLIPGSCREPEYPLASIRRKESGRALIRLYVAANGTVTDARVVISSGSDLLDQETANAFWVCRFLPAHDATGAAMKSTYPKSYEWQLEKAPPDPWALLREHGSQGFAAMTDFSAVSFSGESAANPEQRAKMLHAASVEAQDKAQCPSIEQASARTMPASEKMDARKLELWTLKQCGQDMRYVVAIYFPPDRRASFRMMPLAPSQPSP